MSENSNLPILGNILKRIGQPALPELLVNELSGTELTTLLLDVFSRRVSAMTPADLLKNYELNRFVKPADLPVLELRKMELDYLHLFTQHGFDALELSPVSALGCCSIVGTASQHKILTALRGTEVLSDATNAIALHIANIKKHGHWNSVPAAVRHFSTIQRHVRTQALGAPGLTPHFKIAALVSAGYDTGSYHFECRALADHIRLISELYQQYHQLSSLRFRLLCRQGYTNNELLAEKLMSFINENLPDTQISLVTPSQDNAYYQGVQYKIDIDYRGKTYEIGDGGFVNWTQQLLQNKKERMFTTGLGFEFIYRVLNGLL